jgi:hypothetical protein
MQKIYLSFKGSVHKINYGHTSNLITRVISTFGDVGPQAKPVSLFIRENTLHPPIYTPFDTAKSRRHSEHLAPTFVTNINRTKCAHPIQ